jgi:hypothetical protein
MQGGESLLDCRKPESVTMYFAPQWSHFHGTWVGVVGRNIVEIPSEVGRLEMPEPKVC